EDGVTPAPLLEELRATPGIFQVVQTGAPIDDNTPPLIDGAPDPPSSRTFTVEASANANRISLAIMAICTNDGFTGLDSVMLPKGFKPAVYEAAIYDAGSEPNTEAYTDIVDPCQVVGPDTGPPAIPNGNNAPEGDTGIITHHPGIQGVAADRGLDPELHDWQNPAAVITIQRVR
ncbi:MAG: spondin domain-containing protein, partial [Balneolaceae bacterium]|nr:spondin domain-containing protein [Balneolaceae bacterium]